MYYNIRAFDTKRGKQNAYIAEEQTTQRQNEKGQHFDMVFARLCW
jgi:hypothetical protein